jgi:arylformamidase
MPIYDISLPISESLAVWRGDSPVRITRVSDMARGDTATVSQLNINAHVGTHVDAPAHFVLGGGGVDTLDLNVLVGPALVVEVMETDELSAEVLRESSIPPGTERVLFHTRNSARWARGEREFSDDYTAITEDGARWLIERGVRLVGIDYLSVAPFDDVGPTHRALLSAGVIAVEGLNLGSIAPGIYQFVCLPLRLVGVEGAPARAILID